MPTPQASDEVTARVLSPPRTLRWLVILRWHAIAVQAIVVVVERMWVGARVPALAMGFIVLSLAVSNVVVQRRVRARGPRRALSVPSVPGVIGLDVVALTALLALSGAGASPFAMGYLVLVLVAALALTPWRAVLVLVLACAGYGALGPPAALWAGFAATGAVITAVVTRFAVALREQAAALETAKALGAHARTIASLGSLAAGAAHELNTPLGTIAILANELGRVIDADPAQAIDDADVIRDQVECCRTIVQRLAARTTDQVRETPEPLTVERLRTTTMALIPYGETDRVVWRTSDPGDLVLPAEGLAQTLTCLVTNGLHATGSTRGQVRVTVDVDDASIRISVIDRGPGIPAPIRARLGEPFVTTKALGEGMGLGIFLCQSFADAWGAMLRFEDHRDGGTSVILEMPRRCAIREAA